MASKPTQKVTTINDLKQYSQGQLVQLPSFAEGQPFYARIRRPSMLSLARSGKIPNALLTTANSLFLEGGVDSNDESAMKDIFSVIDVLCEACFIEPSYQEIKDAGIELTDDQYMFVFTYSQKGVKALETFRSQS